MSEANKKNDEKKKSYRIGVTSSVQPRVQFCVWIKREFCKASARALRFSAFERAAGFSARPKSYRSPSCVDLGYIVWSMSSVRNLLDAARTRPAVYVVVVALLLLQKLTGIVAPALRLLRSVPWLGWQSEMRDL